mmetsp:Transcript_3802/g.8689  ORF Transcript_3802/g.8689 Transcript_3802/m.8689 type:complete len:493 (-) Transcript_3802:300-1778(-)
MRVDVHVMSYRHSPAGIYSPVVCIPIHLSIHDMHRIICQTASLPHASIHSPHPLHQLDLFLLVCPAMPLAMLPLLRLVLFLSLDGARGTPHRRHAGRFIAFLLGLVLLLLDVRWWSAGGHWYAGWVDAGCPLCPAHGTHVLLLLHCSLHLLQLGHSHLSLLLSLVEVSRQVEHRGCIGTQRTECLHGLLCGHPWQSDAALGDSEVLEADVVEYGLHLVFLLGWQLDGLQGLGRRIHTGTLPRRQRTNLYLCVVFLLLWLLLALLLLIRRLTLFLSVLLGLDLLLECFDLVDEVLLIRLDLVVGLEPLTQQHPTLPIMRRVVSAFDDGVVPEFSVELLLCGGPLSGRQPVQLVPPPVVLDLDQLACDGVVSLLDVLDGLLADGQPLGCDLGLREEAVGDDDEPQLIEHTQVHQVVRLGLCPVLVQLLDVVFPLLFGVCVDLEWRPLLAVAVLTGAVLLAPVAQLKAVVPVGIPKGSQRPRTHRMLQATLVFVW